MEDTGNSKSSVVRFGMEDGISPDREPIRRMLSHMQGMYLDKETWEDMMRAGDRPVYLFYDMDRPKDPGELAYGTTVLFPGKVGDEYFMTKGHFHAVLDTAEIYYCIRGHGFLLMENPEGQTEIREMKPGVSVYVPPRHAHRSINVSETESLITFFAYRADAGHDYKTIETKGFRKLLVERNGKPELIPNPHWKV